MELASIIFVFGSNLAGRHGKGAALDAYEFWGAAYGIGIGLVNQSYAIPTKDIHLQPLLLQEIKIQIAIFLGFADRHPELDFQVTRVGCGLAGYGDREMAPLFRGATANVHLPISWKSLLLRSSP